MKILESSVAGCIKKTYKSEVGYLYCFNHIAVIEFKEGVHVSISLVSELLYELVSYFGTSRPFGLISNRVNSYSISLMDSELIKNSLQNLVAYGVVGYSNASDMNSSLENDFCQSQEVTFKTIYEALDSVYSEVKKEILITLD